MNNQTSKTKIVIISLSILIIGAAAFYFFSRKGTASPAATETQTPVTFTIGSKDIDLGNSNQTSSQNTGGGTLIGDQIVTGKGIIPALRKITNNPVAGASSKIIRVGKDEKTLVRYIERVTGHIYEIQADSWLANRISNTTIPKIYDAIWASGADSAYIRTTPDEGDDIETYYEKIISIATTTKSLGASEESDILAERKYEVEGVYLPRNIQDLAIHDAQNKLVYLIERNGRGVATLSDLNGSNGKEFFDSPLSEFAISWPKSDVLTFTTKPSSSVPGFLFFGNTAGSNLKKIIGDTNGLTTLIDPSASKVLYGESTGTGYSLNLYALQTKKSSLLSLATLPEKCVWSAIETDTVYCAVPIIMPAANYPDAWYQGIVSFTDEIWKIDVVNGRKELLAKPSETAKENVDGIKLFLSPKEDYLFFINKKNSDLWSLRLVDETATSTETTE